MLASVLDAYLIHVDADNAENIAAVTLPGVHYAAGINPIQVEKNKVGNLLRLIREYNNLFELSVNDPNNRLIELELAAKKY